MMLPEALLRSKVAGRDRTPQQVVAILGLAYLFNFLDRQLLTVLAQPIKLELGLTDTQLGALTGLTFALFYTVFGIPVAVLADRWNRVRLVAIACALWSVCTIATGAAGGFAALVLARIGVGVGEAGGSPPSYSIISDYFPPSRRGAALAAYSLGVPAGALLGSVLGALIASHWGWRAAFVVIGTAGLLLAPIIVATVREPQRGRFDDSILQTREARASFTSALSFFLRSPPLMLNAVSAGLMAFVGYGIMNWAPAFLMRVQGMSLSRFAAIYGLVIGLSGALGLWLGGVIADRVSPRKPMLGALLPGLGMLASVPFLFGATGTSDWSVSVALLVVPLVMCGIYLAPALVTVQNRTPAQYRATESAVLLFVLNLAGMGGGPLYVGKVSDLLEPQYGIHALGQALRWLTPFMVAALLAQFALGLVARRDDRRRERLAQRGG
jgi:MFS family permease